MMSTTNDDRCAQISNRSHQQEPEPKPARTIAVGVWGQAAERGADGTVYVGSIISSKSGVQRQRQRQMCKQKRSIIPSNIYYGSLLFEVRSVLARAWWGLDFCYHRHCFSAQLRAVFHTTVMRAMPLLSPKPWIFELTYSGSSGKPLRGTRRKSRASEKL